MESLRQNAVIHEIDPATEIEFPSPAATAESKTDQSAPDLLPTLKLLWEHRRWLSRVAAWSLVISSVIAFLIPNHYESSVSIMPPDSMNGSGTMLAALAAKASPELAAMAGGLLGTKGSGALFVDLFRSRSVQDRVVDRLNLQKVYWSRYKQDARKTLNSRTDVSEDRKSGVISLTVTDRNPQRAHDIAQAYVEELNRLVSQVSTSSARRERIFIEQRLTSVKSDLEDAETQFSAFASKNSALDIKEQTKAMVESAASAAGTTHRLSIGTAESRTDLHRRATFASGRCKPESTNSSAKLRRLAGHGRLAGVRCHPARPALSTHPQAAACSALSGPTFTGA